MVTNALSLQKANPYAVCIKTKSQLLLIFGCLISAGCRLIWRREEDETGSQVSLIDYKLWVVNPLDVNQLHAASWSPSRAPLDSLPWLTNILDLNSWRHTLPHTHFNVRKVSELSLQRQVRGGAERKIFHSLLLSKKKKTQHRRQSVQTGELIECRRLSS